MELVRHDDGVLQVRGDLHISEVAELRKSLMSELSERSTLVLELSEVASCDAASLQLLCSLEKSAARDGKEVRFSAPSAGMREASAILGLSLEDLTNVPKN